MSYILDALRRADAERQRGQAPGLQQVTHETLAAPASGPGRRLGGLLALLLMALAGAAAAWWWLHARPVAAPAVVLAPPQPAATVVPAAQPASAASASAAPAPAPPPAPAPAPPPAPPPPLAAVAPKPPTAAASAATPPAGKPSAPASAPAPTPRPVLAANLPEPLRGSVLRLPVGGVVHSQDRSQSFVMVGGQIAREGDTLAPGITLERIEPRALLLRVAGQAVELPL